MNDIVVRFKKGCPFCEFNDMRELDQRIFDRIESDEHITWAVKDDYQRNVTESEVRAHRKHLTTNEMLSLNEEESLLDNHASNLDVVKARLNRVRSLLLQHERMDDINKDYTQLLNQFTKLIELKAKLEGQVVERSEITVADIVKHLKEPEEKQ